MNVCGTNPTSIKKKIENNWNWEGALYQSESVKINSSWVIFIFSFYNFMCYKLYVLLIMHPNDFVFAKEGGGLHGSPVEEPVLFHKHRSVSGCLGPKPDQFGWRLT